MKISQKDVLKEIECYKWLESEKQGGDIGFEKAAVEWISNHFENWLHRKPERSFTLYPCFDQTVCFF